MVYFDCSSDDAYFAGTLPCQDDHPASWTHFGWQIFWSFFAWFLLIGGCWVYHPVWEDIVGSQAWATKWVGTTETKPHNSHADSCLRVIQLLSSTAIFVCWIWKSYTLSFSVGAYTVEIIACLGCFAHLVYSCFKHGFSVGYAMSPEGFIDAFTITPLLLQPAPGGMWLTLAYLRTYRMKTAFKRICASGILEP